MYVLFIQYEKAKVESASMHTQYKGKNLRIKETTNDAISAEVWKMQVATSSEKHIKIQLDFT